MLSKVQHKENRIYNTEHNRTEQESEAEKGKTNEGNGGETRSP